MKVVLIFRPKGQSTNSIEEIFNNLYLNSNLPLDLVRYEVNNNLSFFQNVRLLKSIKGDVYHITGDVNYYAPFLYPAKVLLTIHDIGRFKTLKGIKKWLYRFWWLSIPIRFSKKITTVSQYTKNDLIHLLNTSEHKIEVIHNPVPVLFQNAVKNPLNHPPVILQVGTGVHKNVASVVKAIQGINCVLILIGPISGQLKKELDENQVNWKNFIGIDYSEVYSWYKKSDVVTFVSLHEGFGMPALEAQAVGRPVITSNVCSIPEVIPNEYPRINDPNDVGSIRNLLLKVLNDSEYYERLVELGRKNVINFSMDIISNKYFNVYRTLVKKVSDLHVQ